MHISDNERDAIFERQFTRFMVTIVRNARSDYIRRRSRSRRREILLSDIPEHMQPYTDDNDFRLRLTSYKAFMDDLSDPALFHAIQSLTERQKQVLYLFFALDMSCREIGVYLRCTPRSVQKVKKTALETISSFLEV